MTFQLSILPDSGMFQLKWKNSVYRAISKVVIQAKTRKRNMEFVLGKNVQSRWSNERDTRASVWMTNPIICFHCYSGLHLPIWTQSEMVGRTLSNRVKAQVQRKLQDARMKEAINAYLHEKTKPDGSKKRGARPIADAHGVCYKTLLRLTKGSQSMSAFNASKRKLTYAEERVLIDFILESADRAVPLTSKNIETHANAILAFRDTPGDPAGINWVARFLERSQDELQTHWSSPLATERARSLNKEAVKHWFNLVYEKLVEKGIDKYNIYGMDESGFPPSDQGRTRVVGRRGSKMQHKSGSANRENVTALVTICADGTALKPTIIFKGRNFLKKWGEDNVSGAS
jgi:hypothetical protein